MVLNKHQELAMKGSQCTFLRRDTLEEEQIVLS